MVVRCPECSHDNTKGICENCGFELEAGAKEREEYWQEKKKRDRSNIVIGLIIIIAGLLIAIQFENWIIFFASILLAGFLYQRDQ